MRYRSSLHLLIALVTVGLIPEVARAQNDPNLALAVQSFAAYNGGNIDQVSLSNGALSVEIPLISYPQLGKLKLEFALLYVNGGDSYTPASDPYGTSNGVLQHGWTLIVKNWPTATGNTYPASYPNSYYTVSISTPGGGIHEAAPLSASQWESVDATGYHVTTNADTFEWNGYGAVVTDPDGTIYTGLNTSLNGGEEYLPLSWFEQALMPQTITDTNGNQITVSVSDSYLSTTITGWTDSVGRSIPVPATDSSMTGCPSGTYTALSWAPPGYDSGTYPIEFCFTQVSEEDPLGNYGPSSSTYDAYNLAAVILPNGTMWKMQYSGTSDNDLTSITLPTGGKLSYTWTGGQWSGGLSYLYECGASDTTVYYPRMVATRTLTPNDSTSPSGTWTYNYSSLPTSMTVEDPDGNYAQHTFTEIGSFCAPYETQAKYYQGSTSGTLLKTINTAYSDNNPDIDAFGKIPLNVIPTSIKTVWAATSQQSEVDPFYDTNPTFYDPIYNPSDSLVGSSFAGTYGRMSAKWEYDYGSGSTGALLRATNMAYTAFSSSSFLTANLLNLPSSIIVENGSSTVVAETTYAYDESSYASCTSAPCGQLTTTTQYIDSSHSLPTHTYYNSHGMPTSVKDPNNNTTTYSYDSTGVFLSEIQYPTTGSITHTVQFTHDPTTGLLTSYTDQNGQETTYSNNSMLRIAGASFPDGGSDAYTYTDSTPDPYVSFQKAITPSSINFVEQGTVDGLGRLSKTTTTVPSSTCSGGYSYVTTTYDDQGRIASVTNPNCSSSSTVGISTQYDALGRVTTVTEQDGGIVTTSYSGPCATTTDQAAIVRKGCTDGLGRLTSVWENPSGLDYATVYGYDANNDLTSVSENSSRSRSFAYDFLSRLTSAANPESGTTYYYYTTSGSSLCAGDISAVCRKTDARSITTTYAYDALNRLTQKSYSDSTPTVNYVYDGGSLPSGCSVDSFSYGSYPKPQRTAMCDAAGSEAWSYDKMGRALYDQRITNSITETMGYTYNYDGSIATLAYPSGRTITYTPNVIALPVSAVDTANSINYATSGTYMPFGALASLTNGSSLATTQIYDNRLQPCWTYATTGTALATSTSCTATDSTPGNILDYKYNFDLSIVNTPCSTSFSSPTNNGSLASLTNNITTTRSQNFCYDALNRISQAETTSTYSTSTANCWGESYTIDAWANLTAITPLAGSYSGCTQESGLSITVNSNNQITTTGFGYDYAGNMTNGPTSGYTYTYNAENQMTQAAVSSTAGYVYDGDGKRVEKTASGSAYKLYWYDTSGNVLDETDGSGSMSNSSFNEYVFFNGTRISRRDSSSNVYFYFADHLGSERVITNSSGTICYDVDYYPYGGERDSTYSCSQNYKFTGKERDSESNLDDSQARYYSYQLGRFMSPDPANAGADPTNPQSWNMYAYVLNNPLSNTDPTGLDCAYLNDPGNAIESTDSNSDPNECAANGGFWADGTINGFMGDPNSDNVVLSTTSGGVFLDSPDGSVQQQMTTCPLGPGGVASMSIPGFSNDTFRASFDSNDLLNGVAINLGNQPQTMNVGGNQISLSPNTSLGIHWVNGTMPGSFTVGANPAAQVSTGTFTSMKISSITFGGNGFQANGSAYLLGFPLGSGPIDNSFNTNFKLVIQATDLANTLATHPVSCQALGGTQ